MSYMSYELRATSYELWALGYGLWAMSFGLWLQAGRSLVTCGSGVRYQVFGSHNPLNKSLAPDP